MRRHNWFFRPMLEKFEDRNPAGSVEPLLASLANGSLLASQAPPLESWLGESRQTQTSEITDAVTLAAPIESRNSAAAGDGRIAFSPREETESSHGPGFDPSWLLVSTASNGDFAAYAGALTSPAPAGDGASPSSRHDAGPFRNPTAAAEPAAPARDASSQFGPDRAAVRTGTGDWVGIIASGHSLRNARTVADATLPYGQFAFEVHGVVPGGSATVQMFLPANARPSTYFKQDNAGAMHRFDFDGRTGAVIDGNVVTLHLQDGGRGDADGVANGVIVDPGGPGYPVTANDDSYTVKHDRPLVIYPDGLLANDVNESGMEAFAVVVTEPAHGSVNYGSVDLSLTGVGAFQYTPDSLYVGQDSFTYKLLYGENESNAATVTINVTNAVPVAVSDVYSMTEDQRLTVLAEIPTSGSGGSQIDDTTPISAGIFNVGPDGSWYGVSNYDALLENDADNDSDILRTILVDDVTNGKLALYDDGSFVYTPNSNFVGTDTFSYFATDGIADSPLVTATINVTVGSGADLDGRDVTTGTRWMTEGEEQAYGLGISTVSTGDILARNPQAPTTDPGWQLDIRQILFDPQTLVVGGSSTGVINLSGSSDVVLAVTALHDITDPMQLVLSSITYRVGWGHPNLPGVEQFVNMPVGPKVVFEKVEFTTDHGLLLDNTKDPLSVKDAKRFSNVEMVAATKYVAPFSQTIGTQLRQVLTYSTAGVPAGATVTGAVGDSGNQADFAWLSATYNLQANVNGAGVGVIQGAIPTGSIGRYRLAMTYAPTLTLANNAMQALDATKGDLPMYATYGTPRNPANKDELKATVARMGIASPVLSKAFNAAIVRRANAVPPLIGIPTPEQIVLETLRQHVFALENAIVLTQFFQPAIGWNVPHYWTNKFASKVLTPANYKVGGDCLSGAVFTVFATLIYGVPGNIDVKMYTSKSTNEPTTAVEWSTVQGDLYRGEPHPRNGRSMFLTMWDSGQNGNKFEATVIWSNGTTTYYFPSGVTDGAGATVVPVFANADHVLSVFSSFGWGMVVVDPNQPDGKKGVIEPNVQNGGGQWLTYTPPKPTSVNLYQ